MEQLLCRGKYRGTSKALSTSGVKIQHPGIQSQTIIKTSGTSPIGSIARNNNKSLDLCGIGLLRQASSKMEHKKEGGHGEGSALVQVAH